MPSALTRALHIAYPVTIFAAVLASAGLSIVQAAGPDFGHLFGGGPHRPYDRTLFSSTVSACKTTDALEFPRNLICESDFDASQPESGLSGRSVVSIPSENSANKNLKN